MRQHHRPRLAVSRDIFNHSHRSHVFSAAADMHACHFSDGTNSTLFPAEKFAVIPPTWSM